MNPICAISLKLLRLMGFILLPLVLIVTAYSEDLSMHPLFQDGMVLQSGMPVRVWGNANPRETVKVKFAGQEVSGKVSEDGKWIIKLEPLKASSSPGTLLVSSASIEKKISDILVGEVWITSGQSNMQMTLKEVDNAKEEIKNADFPQIRFFRVFRKRSYAANVYSTPFEGKWKHCSQSSAPDFSATAYFFARKLNMDLGVPVGILASYVGGSDAELWTPKEETEDIPYAKFMRRRYDELSVMKVRPNNVPFPLKPAALYDHLIQPMIPFAIRGAIWYQGENNASRPYEYEKLFSGLIRGWRREWGQGDFPFLFVQLPNAGLAQKMPVDLEFVRMAGAPEPQQETWAEIREAQFKTWKNVPNTGMVCTIDTSRTGGIHPEQKKPVGERLANFALAKVYGEDVPYSGPIFREMITGGDKVRLKFDFAEGGLSTRDSNPPRGFVIAGADKVFRWAESSIEGNEIILSNSKTPKPVAVRYAWASNPRGNIVNKTGLPMVPFRTDSWRPAEIKSEK